MHFGNFKGQPIKLLRNHLISKRCFARMEISSVMQFGPSDEVHLRDNNTAYLHDMVKKVPYGRIWEMVCVGCSFQGGHKKVAVDYIQNCYAQLGHCQLS